MKQVIHIYGASGSGTSTLGRKICEELGYFFMDTDDYFWMPTDPMFTTKRPVEERLEMMKKDIAEHDNVVISGSLVDWGDELIPQFTLAIRLFTDTNVRLERLHAREGRKFGARIEEGGDMYEEHLAFLEWASQYDTGSADMRSKAKHDLWQEKLECRQIELKGDDDLDRNFQIVKAVLGGAKHVVVVPYDEAWKQDFIAIRDELAPALGLLALAIEHVGSTSVEGLSAKPIIDIDVVIEDRSKLDEVIKALGTIGYTHEGDQGIPGREAFHFSGKEHLRNHHLYVCDKNASELKRHLSFRDYLRAHPEAVAEYSRIKEEGAVLFPYDIDGYIEHKGPFIQGIYKEIGL